MSWEILSSENQFLQLLSSCATFAVFKHSTRCSVSSMAKSRIDRDWNLDLPIYYLDLIQYRSLSNLIAEKTLVEHQSPQLILFKDGNVIYDASHTAIMVSDVQSALTK
jgi:bacillithiol system protein YtxJ